MEDKTREALWQDMEDMMNEVKEDCGGIQVVIQHSPVGESAANSAIENGDICVFVRYETMVTFHRSKRGALKPARPCG